MSVTSLRSIKNITPIENPDNLVLLERISQSARQTTDSTNHDHLTSPDHYKNDEALSTLLPVNVKSNNVEDIYDFDYVNWPDDVSDNQRHKYVNVEGPLSEAHTGINDGNTHAIKLHVSDNNPDDTKHDILDNAKGGNENDRTSLLNAKQLVTFQSAVDDASRYLKGDNFNNLEFTPSLPGEFLVFDDHHSSNIIVTDGPRQTDSDVWPNEERYEHTSIDHDDTRNSSEDKKSEYLEDSVETSYFAMFKNSEENVVLNPDLKKTDVNNLTSIASKLNNVLSEKTVALQEQSKVDHMNTPDLQGSDTEDHDEISKKTEDIMDTSEDKGTKKNYYDDSVILEVLVQDSTNELDDNESTVGDASGTINEKVNNSNDVVETTVNDGESYKDSNDDFSEMSDKKIRSERSSAKTVKSSNSVKISSVHTKHERPLEDMKAIDRLKYAPYTENLTKEYLKHATSNLPPKQPPVKYKKLKEHQKALETNSKGKSTLRKKSSKGKNIAKHEKRQSSSRSGSRFTISDKGSKTLKEKKSALKRDQAKMSEAISMLTATNEAHSNEVNDIQESSNTNHSTKEESDDNIQINEVINSQSEETETRFSKSDKQRENTPVLNSEIQNDSDTDNSNNQSESHKSGSDIYQRDKYLVIDEEEKNDNKHTEDKVENKIIAEDNIISELKQDLPKNHLGKIEFDNQIEAVELKTTNGEIKTEIGNIESINLQNQFEISEVKVNDIEIKENKDIRIKSQTTSQLDTSEVKAKYIKGNKETNKMKTKNLNQTDIVENKPQTGDISVETNNRYKTIPPKKVDAPELKVKGDTNMQRNNKDKSKSQKEQTETTEVKTKDENIKSSGLMGWFSGKKQGKQVNKYSQITSPRSTRSVNGIIITTTSDETVKNNNNNDSKLDKKSAIPEGPAVLTVVDETKADPHGKAGRLVLANIKQKLKDSSLSGSNNSSGSLPLKQRSRSPSPENSSNGSKLGKIAHKTQSMSSLQVPGAITTPRDSSQDDDNISLSSRRDSTSRRSVDYRIQNAAVSMVQDGAEEKPKNLLTNDETFIKNAIPYLPLSLAIGCLILNIVLPGSGTALSGLSILCCGQARVSNKNDQILTTLCANCMVGFAQLFTVTFFLVGWFWSIAWGIQMVTLSVQHREELKKQRAKELQAMALSAFGSPKRGAPFGP